MILLRVYIAKESVSPDESSLLKLHQFDEMMPEETSSPTEVLDMLNIGSKATVAYNSPNYFGFVNGGVLPVTMAAR